jgi:predicted dehydrogenase
VPILSQIPLELDIHEIMVKKEEPLKRELMAFVRSAETGTKPLADGWEALENLRVCDTALRSLTEGRGMKVV